VATTSVVLASTYGKNAAGRIEFRDGTLYLTIAPALTDTSERRYDWNNKKNFRLDRSELHAMKVVMETALTKNVGAAQELCGTLFGTGKKNCIFTHVTPMGQAMAGVELTEDNAGMYAPFRLRITYYSKNQSGKEETLRVGMTRMNAMMIINDISVFNQEFIQNMVRHEIATARTREQLNGNNKQAELNGNRYDGSEDGMLP